MPGIKTKAELVTELDAVLAQAEAGEVPDVERLRAISECAHSYVPEFSAGGEMGAGSEADSGILSDLGSTSGGTDPAAMPTPKGKRLIPLYGEPR